MNCSDANQKKNSQDQQTIQSIVDASTEQQDDSTFRILLVSHYCPSRAHAGGLRILDIYSLIRHQYPTAQIDLLTFHRPPIDWSLDDVYQIFHNVYLSPVEKLTPEVLFELRGAPLRYDVIDLQFHESGYQINAFRQIGRKIIFTPMESLVRCSALYMRATLKFNSAFSLRKTIDSLKFAAEEIGFALKVDQVVCVSKADASFFSSLCWTKNITFLETAVSTLEFADIIHNSNSPLTPESKEDIIVYVAYFGSETNIIALKWYLEYVHPLVEQAVPSYKLQVVGRGNLSVFDNYLSNSIEFIGEVPSLIPAINNAKVGIAPALNGSGLRGKINQYAIFGVPSVVSAISAKGLAYEDGVNIYIADEPKVFADRCIRLLKDNELNKKMGQLARETAFAHYSWESKIIDIQKIYALPSI